MAEDHSLPGWPKKKLVKDVRRQLSHYGIRPVRVSLWRATWEWAGAIARSYYHDHWPLPSEIATQYILLLLAEMKTSTMLRLPFRAKDVIPAHVAELLPGQSNNPLMAIADRPSGRKARRLPGLPVKEKDVLQRDPEVPRIALNSLDSSTGTTNLRSKEPKNV